MRTILRCNSIFSSRESRALTGAVAWSVAPTALPGAGGAGCSTLLEAGFFSAVAVGFLLTEGRWIDRKRVTVWRSFANASEIRGAPHAASSGTVYRRRG